MPAKIRTLLDTYRLNFRLTQWPETVLDPLAEPATILEAFHQRKAAIDADANLTPKGKNGARVQAATEALQAIGKWHAPNLAGIDQDLGAQRAALTPKGDKPDQRRVELLASRLIQFTQEENSVFYNSATDEERQVMEAASSMLGRIPVTIAPGCTAVQPRTAKDRSRSARPVRFSPEGE